MNPRISSPRAFERCFRHSSVGSPTVSHRLLSSFHRSKDNAVAELQADEIPTIVGGKEQPIWVFAIIEVWSRLWLAA
jgi:hypothetical protein